MEETTSLATTSTSHYYKFHKITRSSLRALLPTFQTGGHAHRSVLTRSLRHCIAVQIQYSLWSSLAFKDIERNKSRRDSACNCHRRLKLWACRYGDKTSGVTHQHSISPILWWWRKPLSQDVPSTTLHIPPRAFTYDMSAFILQQSSKLVVDVLWCSNSEFVDIFIYLEHQATIWGPPHDCEFFKPEVLSCVTASEFQVLTNTNELAYCIPF